NVAPALLWMALLLAMLRSSENFLQGEYSDGVLEQWLISQQPLVMIVQVKLLVHWLLSVVPLIMLSPLLLLFYHYALDQLYFLILAILFGSPALLCLCALAATFGVGLQQRGVMMALIVFPLVIPVMILGSGLPEAVRSGQEASALLALILAMSVLAASLLPFAMAAIIRSGLAE
ncbi:MAG: heme exporter protein CcmB, partial [Natronohydrobacter sp.]|nr:heme exporter protein CcmB [Natronohydrobacter sp.]